MKSVNETLQMAIHYQQAGKLQEAETICKQLLQNQPNQPEAIHLLGLFAYQMGRNKNAINLIENAIKINPGVSSYHYNLGVVLGASGDLEKAAKAYQQAIRCKPEYVEAFINLGNIQQKKGQINEAVESYKNAVLLKPDCAEAHNNLGNVQNYDVAIECYKRALEINPKYIEALGNLAELLERWNRLDEAQSVVANGLELAPKNPSLNIVAAKLERRQGHYRDAIERIEKIECTGVHYVTIQHLLGNFNDQIGNSQKAFNHFMEGNRLSSQQALQGNVNKNIYVQEIDTLAEYFKRDVVSSWRTNHVPELEDNPVFLMGFPRSGTTLLGQILECHPRFQTLEEKSTIETLKLMMSKTPSGFPNALANITPEQILQYRTCYTQMASEYLNRRSNTILIDKMPLNIPLVPLIWRIFSKAKILFVLRHPCDVCLSCFMQNFGISKAMANFFTIEDAANLYAKVMGLWRRYEEIFPLDYYTVRYEDLVEDFESETRRILDFFDVEWEDKIFKYNEYDKKHGPIKTPSYHQVTKPIYQNAKYRWQRYTVQLEPVMETLMPFINHFGYSI